MSAESGQAVAEATEDAESRLSLQVSITDSGACRKHVAVTVSEADIKSIREDAIEELSEKAQVPGFRTGKVPASLLLKRFKDEISADIKQKVLLASLEQLSDEYEIEPISEPKINVESLEIPDAGDFQYEFDVEVRPEFDIPDYSGITITRAVGEISEAEFARYRTSFLTDHAERLTTDDPAAAGDFVLCNLTCTHEGRTIREATGQSFRLLPQLNFHDAVLNGFDSLMSGVVAGESRDATVVISLQSPIVEMRGETVSLTFEVTEVQQLRMPDLDETFLGRMNVTSAEEFDVSLRSSVQRQEEYSKRQETRRQVLDAITASADWDLPESLVRQQADNALRREILEMAQAGFTHEQIAARENQLRQNVIEATRENLKQHFILDKIASKEEIDCEQSDIDRELLMMSFQSGEPVRKIRARMVKSGMIENLEAQLRERKAVDFLLSKAKFNDVPRVVSDAQESASARFAICGNMTTSLVDDSAVDAEDSE